MSELLSSLFKKQWHEWFNYVSSELLSNNKQFSWKKIIFFVCFSLLFPFLCPRANRSPRSLLLFLKRHYRFAFVAFYKRVTVNELLPSLISKKRPWVILSCCSLQKSNGSDLLFSKSESLFCLLAHKKRAICPPKMSNSLKRPKSEFQPCIWPYFACNTCILISWHCSVERLNHANKF